MWSLGDESQDIWVGVRIPTKSLFRYASAANYLMMVFLAIVLIQYISVSTDSSCCLCWIAVCLAILIVLSVLLPRSAWWTVRAWRVVRSWFPSELSHQVVASLLHVPVCCCKQNQSKFPEPGHPVTPGNAVVDFGASEQTHGIVHGNSQQHRVRTCRTDLRVSWSFPASHPRTRSWLTGVKSQHVHITFSSSSSVLNWLQHHLNILWQRFRVHRDCKRAKMSSVFSSELPITIEVSLYTK